MSAFERLSQPELYQREQEEARKGKKGKDGGKARADHAADRALTHETSAFDPSEREQAPVCILRDAP